MIREDDFEDFITTPERIQYLGFKPQKEILTNHLLPYADKLDEESKRFLEQVKINLGKAVMLREMKPACGVWSSRLMKYIRIHGLKFGKEDHIAFIKLAYELVLIPDLEPCKVHKFATMFLMLTKEKHLITPEELVLPWRPLYEIGIKIFHKNATSIGMYNYHTSLEGSYISMIKRAKPYFDVNATKEILEELLPFIFPWSSNSQMMSPITALLPVGLNPKYAKQGHELWFDQLMMLWDTGMTVPGGISEIMYIFAGLAKKNPGAVDWAPYVPKMFTRFLHALNLPVGYKNLQCSRNQSLDMKHVATWIVWTINPDGVVLDHLKCFLAGVESYLHSANAGRWSFKLRDFLKKLAGEFLYRVRHERETKYQKSWENKTPINYKLRDEDITNFVTIVLEPAFQSVYSRSGSLDISIALQNLANLRPAIVIPPLLEKLRTSLTSLTEPHRVTVAMAAVAAVARPMLRGADADYPEGPTHVVPFLLAVLPGLDPNDIKKTLVTLHFILVFSSMVPFIDCSSAHEHWPDLTEEELLVCESTAQFEDFVLILFERLFTLIESSVLEHARLDTKDFDCARSKNDAVTETAISSAATAVLIQCSPKIFKEALRKFKTFATDTTFETNVSGSMVGVLIHVFARIDSESTLAAFLPELLEDLEELISSDEALREENPPRDMVYRLVLLMRVVDCDGSILLKYIPKILPVLDRILKLHTRYALTRACEVLGNIFSSLSYVDLKEWRSSPNDYGSAPEKWLPIREWGRSCLLKNANLKWHVPSIEEAECAQMISDRYLIHEVKRLKQWLSGERPMCRERRLRSFHIINAVFSCNTFLPQSDEEPISLIESQVPPMDTQFATAVPYTVTLDGENMRVAITRLLLAVQKKMLDDKTDDTRGLEMLIQVWERVCLKGSRTGAGLETRLRSYNTLERVLGGRGGIGGRDRDSRGVLRMLVADAVRLQDESRLDFVCDAGVSPTVLQALHALYDLSINTYSSVRMLAQCRLHWMLNHYPFSYRVLVPRLVSLFNNGGEGEEWHAQHKGALFILLGPKSGLLGSKPDWEVVSALWPAILKAPLSEKPSIHKLEQAISDTLHRNFPVVNTRLTITQSAVDAAKRLLDETQMNDTEFIEQLKKAVERENAISDKAEKLYYELIEELVHVARNSNNQWRRLELAMQFLTYCPLLQTPYPPSAVQLIAEMLLHDDIAVRRTAMRLTHFALKQRKHKLKKIEVDPYEVAGVQRPEKHIPGYRKDLEWAMWSKDREIKTDEDWDKPWLRDYCYGFYAWPKKIKVAAPVREQKYSLDISPEEMEEGERHLFEFFNNDANIEKLVAFLTVEEKKGKDKFSGIRFSLFRMLFAHFGERVSDRLLAHALRCASDTQEAPQRFAAELATAALRAPRYWPRQRALDLQQFAMDIVRAGLTAVTPETMDDWGTCVATGVDKLDPTRGKEVLRQLMELCAPPPAAGDVDPDQHTSFVLCARLYALQGALGSLKWRVAPLAGELLQRLEVANFIHHPFQNVRETIGSLLMTIFYAEVIFPGGESGGSPRFGDFLASIKPKLAALYDENGDIVIKTTVSPASMGACGSRSLVSQATPGAGTGVQVPVSALAPVSEPSRAHLAPEAPRPTRNGDGSDPANVERVTSAIVDKQLVVRLDSALRLAGDDTSVPTPAEQHHAIAVNLLATVLRGCIGMIVRGVNANTVEQYELVPVACALACRGPPQPHEELPRAAGGFLATLALAKHSCDAFDKALDVLETLSEGRSWWARLASLDFAQPLLFYGLPLLCEQADRAVRAEKFTLKLMRDSRVEVRQTAAKLLTGLMHCRALQSEEKTLKALMKSCRSKELLERHCGVLGLCAYLASRPYSLGPRLGDVLAELSRHTSAPDPIPATIRNALADFRRTHQDDWPKHREQLTEEELDLLADLTSPPSYCA